MKNILRMTGNPFVDAGVAALCALTNHDRPQEITKDELKKASEELMKFYLQIPDNPNEVRWTGLNRFFTINCKWTNPSYKKTRYEECRRWIKGLVGEIEPLGSSGTCAACGAREADALAFSHESPLTGTGDFRNYFSFFETGFPLCNTCIFTMQFAPLTLLSPDKILLLLHSHEFELMLLVAKEALKGVERRLHLGLKYYWPDEVPIKRKFAFGKKPKMYNVGPQESFVRLVAHLLAATSQEFTHDVTIRLYRLFNAGQQIALSYYDLPSDVFRFIRLAQTQLKSRLEEMFNQANPRIFATLINREKLSRILGMLLRKDDRRLIGGWNLLELYLKEVEKMSEDRIRVLKEVADRLYEYLKSTNFKRLKNLEQADKYGDLRMLLTRIQKETLIYRIDDEELLFPQTPGGGVMWRGTQALLLARIYERMHDDKINPKEV